MQCDLCKLTQYVLINLILIPVFIIFPGKNTRMALFLYFLQQKYWLFE